MEEIEEQLEEKTSLNYKFEIYSEQAIWVISFLFSTIFGVVLLMQNLKDIGKDKEAYFALSISIIYTIIVVCFVPPMFISLSNLVGGFFLTNYFFYIYFYNIDDYGFKEMWKPLIVSTLISLITVTILVILLKIIN